MKEIPKLPPKIESSLKIIANTGKIEIGLNNVIWIAKHRSKHVKMIVISRNMPENMLEKLSTNIRDKKIKIYRSLKTNIELGETIGRPHSVAALAILDYGALQLEE